MTPQTVGGRLWLAYGAGVVPGGVLACIVGVFLPLAAAAALGFVLGALSVQIALSVLHDWITAPARR